MEKMSIIEYICENDEKIVEKIYSTIKNEQYKSLREILIKLSIPFNSVENGLLISITKENNLLKLICLTDEERPSFEFIKNIKDYYNTISCKSKRLFVTGKDFFEYKKIKDKFLNKDIESNNINTTEPDKVKFLILNTGSKVFFETDVFIKKITPKYLFFEETAGLYREKISTTELGTIDKNAVINHNGMINISCFCKPNDFSRCKETMRDYVKEKLETELNKIKTTLEFISKIK